jgi:hypothetical protein
VLIDEIVNRVHWLRAKAQFERWKEEQDSIHNEAVWVPAYFQTKADCWRAWMKCATQDGLCGHAAYASRQAHAWDELARSSIKALIPITSASLKHV